MSKLQIVAGATSQSVNIFIQNSSLTTGAGLTGFAPAGGSLLSGMTFYYSFSGTNAISVVQSLSVPAAVNSSFSAGQIVEIDATNMPGVARLDLPNGMLAASKGRSVVGLLKGGTNVFCAPIEIELTAVDNQSLTFGLGTLTANPATGGIVTSSFAAGAITAAVTDSTFDNAIATAVFTNNLTEAYASLNGQLTVAKALYGITQQMGSMSITSTTMTTFKRDNATTAKTYSLNSATTPTAITEAS